MVQVSTNTCSICLMKERNLKTRCAKARGYRWRLSRNILPAAGTLHLGQESRIYIYNLTLHDQRFSFEPTAVGHGIVRTVKRAKKAQSALGEVMYMELLT